MLAVAVVGGTGYTGVELLRLLVTHPQVDLKCVTSRSESGTRVADMFPNLRGFTDLCFTEPAIETLSECDVVFFATPNGTAMKMVAELVANGVRVVDLAADFRLQDPAEWKQWYGMDHACEDIRSKKISRDKAKELIKKHDLQPLGKKYLSEISDFLGYSENELLQILEKYRNLDIWKKNNGEWFIDNHLEDYL